MTTLNVPVKPYIKKYLETNYGNPVNFSGVRGVNDFFTLLLEKQNYRREKQAKMVLYSDIVTITITRDCFYRHGWEMSNTAIISFNAFFEYIIKTRTRDIIRIRTNEAHKMIAHSIRQLQFDFDFSEDCQSFDAIKKDLQRHTDIVKNRTKRIGLSVSKN